MLTIIALIGVLMVVVCTLGLISPQRFLGTIDRFSGKGGYVLAIVARILLGVVAWLAAPQSLLPVFLQFVAVVSMLAAVSFIVMGIDRYRKVIQWVAGLSREVITAWLIFGAVFGAVMVWVTGLL